MSAENSTCVTIGGEEYCDVTIHWTPRVSEVGAICAMVVPTLVLLIHVVWTFCADYRDGKGVPMKVLVESYKRNTRLLYIKDYIKLDDYVKLKTGGEDDEVTDLKNTFVLEPGPLYDEERKERLIRAADVQTARKHRVLFGWALPRPYGYVAMVWKLILSPITIVVWSVVDVLADTFYFYRLERGGLIDSVITPNVHVNNAILAFGVLGALAACVAGFAYSNVLIVNKEEARNHGKVMGWTSLAVMCKILGEDAAELILEYYYVDKYIVDNQPWYLVAKDIITALIYILPLVKIFMSGHKEYEKLPDTRDSKPGDEGKFSYAWITPMRVAMSFTMVFRVIGMVMQYKSGTIDKECFKVENGKLVQTPFTTGCLNWSDWLVLVSVGLVFFSFFCPVLACWTIKIDDLPQKDEPSDS